MAPENQGVEVFLKYLPPSATEDGLQELFGNCGDMVGDVRLLRDTSTGKCKGVGWITFANAAGAKAAMALDGVAYDKRHIQVSVAKQVTWAGGHAATVGGIAGTIQEVGTHTPAMAKEVVKGIVGADTDGVFVDGTFGRGGHSRLILAALGPTGSLHAFDMDPEAVKVGRALEKEDQRFHIHHGGFKSMASVLPEAGVALGEVTGVFLDLGISSPQLDEAARGFRPEQSGPLDLRFDLTKGLAAGDFLQEAPREELIRVLREYGDPSDPQAARRVADAVCLARASSCAGAPRTTKEFADLVASCRGYEYQAMHPAKATFQALRIYLNDEFGELRGGMAASLEVLRPAGRVGVLTWKHSECALLVEYLRQVEVAPPNFPLLQWHKATPEAPKVKKRAGFVADAAKRPTAEELKLNSRSRSAVLHIFRKQRGVLCSDLEAAAAEHFEWESAADSAAGGEVTQHGGSSSSTALAPPEEREKDASGVRAEAKKEKKKRKLSGEAKETPPESTDDAAEEVEGKAKKRKRERREADGSGVAVLHEDDAVLAISKPAGMLCHPSPGYWDHGTVTHALEGRLPAKMLEHRESYTGEADSFIPRAVVHRLDKGTTGVMLLAKTPEAEAHLASQFKGRSMKKRYVAVLLGRPSEKAGLAKIVVDAPIGRDHDRPGKVKIAADGKAAKSVVYVHAYSAALGLSLVTVDLLTGRQHQIRAHCAHLGAPLAGDDDYAGPKALAKFRKALGATAGARPLLHCWSMRLAHPQTEAPLTVEAPLPPDMRELIAHAFPEVAAEDPASWPQPVADSERLTVKLRGLPFNVAAQQVVDFLAPKVAAEADRVKVGNKNKKMKTLKQGDLRPGEAEVTVEAPPGAIDEIRKLHNEHLGGRYIEVTVMRGT